MATALPGGVQGLGLPAEPAPGAFVGAGDFQEKRGRGSQTARLSPSATGSPRRGDARVIKTDEATRFSGFEAIASAPGGMGAKWNLESGKAQGMGCIPHRHTDPPPWGQGASLFPTRQEQHPTMPATPNAAKEGAGDVLWGRAGVHPVTWYGSQQA